MGARMHDLLVEADNCLPAVLAVARNPSMPNASDKELKRAASFGLIDFNGRPAGHWQVTPQGRDLLDRAP